MLEVLNCMVQAKSDVHFAKYVREEQGGKEMSTPIGNRESNVQGVTPDA